MKILAKRLDAYCKHVLYIDHLTFSAQATFVLLPNNKLFRIDSILKITFQLFSPFTSHTLRHKSRPRQMPSEGPLNCLQHKNLTILGTSYKTNVHTPEGAVKLPLPEYSDNKTL